VRATLSAHDVTSLARAGEDRDEPRVARCFDWLTETPVEDRRFGVKVIDRASLAARK